MVYELSFKARGNGEITSFAHPLGSNRYLPVPFRIGNPQSRHERVSTPDWRNFRRLWYACARHVETARVVLTISAQEAGLDLDDVTFRKVGTVYK